MMMGDVKIEGPEESVWEEVAKAAGEMADMVSEASSSSGWGSRRHRFQERPQHAHHEATSSSSWQRLQSSPEAAAGLHTTRPLSSLEGSSVLDGKAAASGLEAAMPHGRPVANRYVPPSHGKPPMYPEPASLSSQGRPSTNAEMMVSMTHVPEPTTAAVPLDERSPGADSYGVISAPAGEEIEETLGMSSHQIKRMRRSAQHAQRAASQARGSWGGSGDWSSDSPAFRTLHAILDIVGALEKHHQEIDILDKAFIAYEKVSKGVLPLADLHLHELQYMKARDVHVQAFTDQHQVLQELLTSSGLDEKDWPQIAREGCALIEIRAGPLPLSPLLRSISQLEQQPQPCIPLSPGEADSTVVATPKKELTAARPHEVSPCTPPAVQDSSLAPTTPCINSEHAASASRRSPSTLLPSQDNKVPKLQAASGLLDVPVVVAVSSGQPESAASAVHQLPAVGVYKDKEQSELALSKLEVQAMLTALSLQGTEGRENLKFQWFGDDPVSPNAMWTVGASPSPPKVSPASNCCRSPPSTSRVEGIQHGGLDKDGYSIPPFDPQALFQAASSVVPLDPKCPLHTRQGQMQPCTTTKPSLVVDSHSDALRQCACGVGCGEWSEWSTEGDKHIQHQQQKQSASPFQFDNVASAGVYNANAKARLPSDKQHACSPLLPQHSASAVQGADSDNGDCNVKGRGNEEKKNWFHTAVGGLGGSLHGSLRALATCLVIMHVACVVSARDSHSQNQNQKRR